MTAKQKKLLVSAILRLTIAGFFVSAAMLHWHAVFQSMPNGSFAIIPALLFTVSSVIFIGEEIL